jgi:nitronate monooxygenase
MAMPRQQRDAADRCQHGLMLDTPDARFFAARLGLELPLVQAPMAGFQGAAMAAAVSGAGALGSLPGAAMTPTALRDAVGTLRRAGCLPVNLNFFCHVPPAPDPAREAAWREALRPYYEELWLSFSAISNGTGRLPFGDEAADVIEELRPEVVSFHFGLPPAPLLERVRRAGAQVWSSATTVAEAQWLAAHGVDAIIAQGLEAGGHRGLFLPEGRPFDLGTQLRTLALLPAITSRRCASRGSPPAASSTLPCDLAPAPCNSAPPSYCAPRPRPAPCTAPRCRPPPVDRRR